MSLLSLHSRRFWVLFLSAALIAAIAAFKLMFNNIPLLKVDVTFNRTQAVSAAAQLQKKYFPGLVTTRSSTMFVSDRGLQNYVELEGGGLDRFKTLVNNLDAVTHYWKVRNFSEGQEKETIMAFSAKGEPISFWLKIPEKEPGAALEESAARDIAERGARDFMGERFAAYKAYDSKKVRQTSGRVDYSFTYEHQTLKVGEAQFRISINVAGDKLIAIDTFKYIPEAFNQRFEKMRALNNQISQIATYLMIAVLGLGGLVGGGFWLYKHNQLQWKRGFLPATFVGAGLAASAICNLPMSWFGYDTTISANNFLLQQFFGAGVVLVASAFVFATIYSVAEGLSRIAFADHPRLFDVVRKPAAASPEILGRVIGAYGWTGFFLLYAMLFVVLSSSLLGWWQPTDMQSDPNILASWRPALAPIFTALQAGTWEECLFRAIPLSLAAIVGARFGRKTVFVAIALVVQALIFGGAHANYPNLPGYSRLIELFIPAMAFGLVYLRFGLLVGMLTHFLYDLVLMSLPIFFVGGADLWVDQILVVLAGTAPLLLVLWARYRAGASVPLASEFRNGVPALITAEAARPEIAEATPVDAHNLDGGTNTSYVKPFVVNPKILVPLAIAAAVVFGLGLFKVPEILWPAYQLDMAQAKAAGEAELVKRGIVLQGEWHRTSYASNGYSGQMDFVWREADKPTFQRLVGSYLDTPYWVILWRKYDGEVEQRSEKWEAWLNPDGTLHELVHWLPEGNPGAKLTREQATAKALGWIVEHHWGDASQLEEKSVVESVRPARSDWTVTYIDKAAFNHKNAQAVIKIGLSGDEVTGFSRAIDVPDEWNRAEAEKKSKKTPFSLMGALTLVSLIGIAVSTFFRKHSGRKFSLKIALPWMLLIGISNFIVSTMWIEGAFGNFQTTAGWTMQVCMAVGKNLLLAGALMLLVFFMAQAIHGERPRLNARVNEDFGTGIAFALVFAGFAALADRLLPSTAVPQAYSADWATFVPWLTEIFNGGKVFLSRIILLIFAIGSVRFIQNKTKLSIYLGLAVLSWLFMGLAAQDVIPSLVKSFVTLLGLALVMVWVQRQQMGIAIAMMGVGVALDQLGISRALYESSWIHALASAICAFLVTYALLWHWHKKRVA